jgi:hypothetical protein
MSPSGGPLLNKIPGTQSGLQVLSSSHRCTNGCAARRAGFAIGRGRCRHDLKEARHAPGLVAPVAVTGLGCAGKWRSDTPDDRRTRPRTAPSESTEDPERASGGIQERRLSSRCAAFMADNLGFSGPQAMPGLIPTVVPSGHYQESLTRSLLDPIPSVRIALLLYARSRVNRLGSTHRYTPTESRA